jgi:5-methyltetrahydrofolate corrinoid/iron sulfur protein methyltransferase
MILVGENLNVANKKLGLALKVRNPGPIREMAVAEDIVDIDYIDVNIGPDRRFGGMTMTWLVTNVRDITGKYLSLNTASLSAMEAGLKICANNTLVNYISYSLHPKIFETCLYLVNQYDAIMIGGLSGVDGIPRNANQRCIVALDLVEKANQRGIVNEKIWIDIAATPVSGDINQLKASFEFLRLLGQITPGCKSIVDISHVSRGAPTEWREYLNRTYLMMLMKYGLQAAIIDSFDSELIDIARGRKPELVSMVHKMMDGDVPHMTSLGYKESIYARTVRIFNGESLRSQACVGV